jgi:hypothetical protein
MLRDYEGDWLRDMFQLSEHKRGVNFMPELSFPCCCCTYNTKEQNDDPCYRCGHNANVKSDALGGMKP